MIDIDLYQHFSFDLWLTIIKSNPDFKLKRDQLFKDFFDLPNSLDEVRNAIRHYDLLCNKISEKTGRHIFRDKIFLMILNDLQVNLDCIHINQINEFCIEVDSLFERNMPELHWLDIELFLQKIKEKGKTSSILSNTAFILGESLRKVLNKLGLLEYFSFEIFSDEIGVSKPNTLIYEALLNKVSSIRPIEKQQIVHIGDNPIADYDGARSFGMSAWLI